MIDHNSSLREKTSVERISSPLVVTEPEQGKLASLCGAEGEHSVNGQVGRDVWRGQWQWMKTPGLAHPCLKDQILVF